MPRSRPYFLLLILLAALLIPPTLVADWTQWRGPQRDGHVAGPDWPETLDGLERVWHVELGKGYPGPIVAADRIFTAETHDGETEIVRALSRATGEEIWRASWPGEGSVPFFAAANGDWIRSTPSYDGETLFVGGMNEVLVALDGDTGEVLWTVDFPAHYKTKVPDFGFSSSPLVVGDDLYVQAANSIVKLNKKTGEILWRSLDSGGDIMVSGAFSSPIVTELAGREQLIVQTRMSLFGVDPGDGSVLWSHDVPSFRGMNILTPLVYDDAIFTSTYRNNSFFYRVTAKEDGGFDVKQEWTNKVQAYMSSPVRVGDHAYMHLGNRRVACVDLRTGEIPWTSNDSFGKYWSKAVQDDKILALDESGDLYLMRANPQEMEILDSRKVTDREAWAHLAISGDEIYVRGLEGITAYRWTGASAEVEQQSAP